MTNEIRVYAVLSAPVAATPTAGEWKAMLGFANTQNLLGVNAVAVAAQNFVSFGKVSQGDAGRCAMITYEVAPEHVGGLLTDANSVLKMQAAALKVSAAKADDMLALVLQKSAQALLAAHPEIAGQLGWVGTKAAAFVSGLTVTVVAYGDRATAIAGVQAYLADNAATWYVADAP